MNKTLATFMQTYRAERRSSDYSDTSKARVKRMPRRNPKSCPMCNNYGMIVRDGDKELCPAMCPASREMVGI